MQSFQQYLREADLLDVPVKTPEELAKKHKVSVDSINRQIEMGIPSEKEHTTNTAAARRIALAHLDELPDYYTRLKKMERGE
jgi:hypothetical protein